MSWWTARGVADFMVAIAWRIIWSGFSLTMACIVYESTHVYECGLAVAVAGVLAGLAIGHLLAKAKIENPDDPTLFS